MDGLEIVRGLMARGYSPHQAAALAGHIGQESGYNPAAVNQDEGAHGLLQWRGSRWQGLQDFAKSQGKDPTDSQVQLDYVGKEMAGPEAKSSAAFRNSTDVAGASGALKNYIRFGDDSAGTRLANANGLFQQIGAPPVGALASPPAAVGAPVGALAAAPPAAPTMAQGLGALGKTLAGPQETKFDPVQPLQIPQANTGQSQQIAAALARAYGIGA